MSVSHLIATVMGVGHLRPASGTWGSLAALPMAYGIIILAGWPGLVIAAVVVFAAGYWATVEQTRGRENHDPSEIVVDEVVGQWVALLPVAYGAGMMGIAPERLWPGWVAAFLLFRLFDIAKPWLVGWADRRDDAMGVMLDDVIAGLFAAVGVVAFAALFHLVPM
ncbi:phosphatidylglycerophosphatase A family protein [Oceaniglobus trochenteri]|uniref:phosphatidylglycerophosphatase A family protein n=1 Tax=Oceaniglobus trochenteri TaxID=2763260 RepID=UPI001CFFAA7A|nr:phosphatidylglycerophosphatase A [Oceaniglobus trochenteri]